MPVVDGSDWKDEVVEDIVLFLTRKPKNEDLLPLASASILADIADDPFPVTPNREQISSTTLSIPESTEVVRDLIGLSRLVNSMAGLYIALG